MKKAKITSTSTADMLGGFLSEIESRFKLSGIDLEKYADRPVDFCLEVLGDQYITEDTSELLESICTNKYTFGRSGNGTGKSFIAARAALWWYLCRKGQVYISAAPPVSNISLIIFGSIHSICNEHPDIFTGHERTTMKITCEPDRFIVGLPVPSTGTEEERKAKFSGKHWKNGVLFLFDEASAIPDSPFLGAETCASDDKSRIFCTFNPHKKIGWVYRMERDNMANVIELSAFNHINVISGKNVCEGAVTRNVTVVRINQMCRPLAKGESPDHNCFELPEFLEGAVGISQKNEELPPLIPGQYKIIEPSFSTIVLGKYPGATSSSLITTDMVNAARVRYDLYVAEYGDSLPKFVKPKIGVDIAEMGEDKSSIAIMYGSMLTPIIAWEKTEIPETEQRIFDECNHLDPLILAIDSTGVGIGVAPHLQKLNMPAVKVMVVGNTKGRDCELGLFKTINDELAWRVREWLLQDDSMMPPDEELIEEMLSYSYSVDRGYVVVTSKDVVKDLIKRSPDKFDSVKLAFYSSGAFGEMDLS